MFKKTSSLGILSGLLLVAACAGSALAETRAGGVEIVASAGAGAGDVTTDAPARLTITGLDRPFRTEVELAPAAAGSSVRVALSAGLYAVDAAASLGEDEPVIPALSAPKLVVVAAGRVTTINVSVEVESAASTGLAALVR